MNFDDVLAFAQELPGVEEGTSYSTRSLKIGKKLLARLREDGDTLVLKPVDDLEQQALMATQPDVFYLTDHYKGWPTILIRLSLVDPEDLRELLELCWGRLATKRLRAARDSRS